MYVRMLSKAINYGPLTNKYESISYVLYNDQDMSVAICMTLHLGCNNIIEISLYCTSPLF